MTWTGPVRRWAAGIPLALAVVACSSSSSSGSGSGSGSASSPPPTDVPEAVALPHDPTKGAACANWHEALASYAPGLPRVGALGKFDFVIDSVVPSPPALGNLVWKVHVLDAT